MATGINMEGKVVNVGDLVTVAGGKVTSISGSGDNATLTVKLGSGDTLTVKARDVHSTHNS